MIGSTIAHVGGIGSAQDDDVSATIASGQFRRTGRQRARTAIQCAHDIPIGQSALIGGQQRRPQVGYPNRCRYDAPATAAVLLERHAIRPKVVVGRWLLGSWVDRRGPRPPAYLRPRAPRGFSAGSA